MTMGPNSRRKDKYEARKVPDQKLATSAMIASLDAEGREAISAPFGHALVDLANKDDRISPGQRARARLTERPCRNAEAVAEPLIGVDHQQGDRLGQRRVLEAVIQQDKTGPVKK